MQPRLNYQQASPGAFNALLDMEKYTRQCGLEYSLIELVKIRASQINGCAYCIDMHTKDARAAGETEQRLYALSVWHETPFYTERERIALELTEAVTLIGQAGVPDELYQRASEQFNEEELVNLVTAIITINGWNRLALAFRAVAGSYQPPARKPATT